MKKILVTSADGFIGSHLTEALVRAGHDVRALVLYNSFNSWDWLDHCGEDVKGKFEVFVGDIRDSNGVRTAMKGRDSVLQLAALMAIPYSYHSPSTSSSAHRTSPPSTPALASRQCVGRKSWGKSRKKMNWWKISTGSTSSSTPQ